MAAMLMLTACAGGNDTRNTDAPDVSESVSETETSAEAEGGAETDAGTESDTEAASDSEQSSVYDGSFYTISVNADKWTNANEYRQAAGEVAESLDNGLDFSAEEYAEMCDALFYHNTASESGFASNFNIVTQDIGSELDMDAAALGPLMAENYDSVEGYECTGWEGVTVNGNDCLKINVSAEQMDIEMDMIQYIFLKGGKQTVVTLTAKKGEAESLLPDFEEVVNTIVLK